MDALFLLITVVFGWILMTFGYVEMDQEEYRKKENWNPLSFMLGNLMGAFYIFCYFLLCSP